MHAQQPSDSYATTPVSRLHPMSCVCYHIDCWKFSTGFAAFCSEYGSTIMTSSFGSTTLT